MNNLTIVLENYNFKKKIVYLFELNTNKFTVLILPILKT
jgi:hypothetical protein